MKALLMCLSAILALGPFSACSSTPNAPREDDPDAFFTVMIYRNARERGDRESARALLADDPRVWFESRDGPGHPLDLEGKGPWGAWDEHFRSEGEDLSVDVTAESVSIVRSEMNDYLRLIERNGAWYRITYFLNNRGKIEGYLVSEWADAPETVDRFDEFEAWAVANHPEEWEYVRPDGRIDPTGDRPERTRKLANEWRAAVGLEPLW